jgi:hypothetical protein
VLARRKPAQRGLSSGLSHGLDAALGGNTAPNISTGLGFSKRGIGSVGTKNTRPGWKRDLRDGCKVWVGVFQRSARAPRPDATTGFDLRKCETCGAGQKTLPDGDQGAGPMRKSALSRQTLCLSRIRTRGNDAVRQSIDCGFCVIDSSVRIRPSQPRVKR